MAAIDIDAPTKARPTVPSSPAEGKCHSEIVSATNNSSIYRIDGPCLNWEGSYGPREAVRRRADDKAFVLCRLDVSDFDTNEVKSVEAEILCLACCDHFAVLRYEAHFIAEKRFLTVVEFTDAGDLDAQIKARAADGMRHFTEREVTDTFVQLCMALDHVHRNGMLHRGIKGANVLLVSSGLVKLGDFGLRQRREDSGRIVAAPFNLAPELWNSPEYSKKADIWSMGILLYEMMALKRPFVASSMTNLMLKITTCEPAPLPDEYSQELKDVCMSMLQRDPARRPSMAAILRGEHMQGLLRHFEHSALGSSTIDAATKELITRNIAEAREHAAELPAAPVGDVEAEPSPSVAHEGPIAKESGGVWKERYLVLKDAQLVISVKKGDTRTSGVHVNSFLSVVPVPFGMSQAEGVFALITRNTSKRMRAPSNAEALDWIHNIQEAMGIA